MVTSKKLNIWIYIRVSTVEQGRKNGPDLQMTKINNYITCNYSEDYKDIKKHTYKDLWISGVKDDSDRPWLRKLKEDVRAWKIDIIIVYKLDRLARKTRLILELTEYFKTYNVTFVSTNERIDTHSHMGTFFLTVLGAIAEMERELFSEKAIEWALEALKKWKFSMWGIPAYGFERWDNGIWLKIIPKEAKIIKEIFNLYVEEGKSLNEIAKILTARRVLTKNDVRWIKRKDPSSIGKWYSTAISTILSNEAYIWLYWLYKTKNDEYLALNDEWREVKKTKRIERDKDEWIAIPVENIIEKEMFDEANSSLVKNKFRNNNNNKAITSYLFTQLIKCWECNSNYKWDKWKPDKEGTLRPYYRCWKTNKGKHWTNKCHNSQIREIELIKNIYGEINKFFQNPNLIIKRYLKLKDNSKEKIKYLRELEENNSTVEKFYEKISILFERITEEKNIRMREILEDKIEWYRKNIDVLEERSTEIQDIMSNNQQIIDDTKAFEKYIEIYKWQDIYELSHEDQKEVLAKIIDKIVVKIDSVDVHFVFRDTESLEENWDTKKSELSQERKSSDCCIVNGGPSGARTRDLRIKSPALYQLS